jgi:hypothetical protein
MKIAINKKEKEENKQSGKENTKITKHADLLLKQESFFPTIATLLIQLVVPRDERVVFFFYLI